MWNPDRPPIPTPGLVRIWPTSEPSSPGSGRGIEVMALGLGAAQFLAPDVAAHVPLVRLLATALVATGVILVLEGAYRYAAERRRIDASQFRPAAGSILAAVVLAVVIAIFAIAFVWLVRR